MQHFLYRIKIMLRERSSIFWNLLFPLFLGFLFFLMFSNIDEAEQFQKIPVGVVTQEQDEFLVLIKSVEIEEGKPMFSVTEYDTEDAAKADLEEETIKGYILTSDSLKLVVSESGMQTTIIKVFVDQYLQNVKLIENIAKKNPKQLPALMEGMMQAEGVTIESLPLAGRDKSPYTQYFYALIAMTCLIASSIGLANGNNIQADLSTLAARRNVAPTRKMKQVLVDFLASYFVVGAMAMIVLAVLILGFSQDFGNNIPLIVLVTWVGSFNGLAAGMMIGVTVKGSKGKKEGISTTFFMGSSFLGGLQMASLPYYIEQNCPIINRINPATLIVNACKSLAVFGDTKQYAQNLIILFLMGVLFLVISILKLRRTKYAYI